MKTQVKTPTHSTVNTTSTAWKARPFAAQNEEIFSEQHEGASLFERYLGSRAAGAAAAPDGLGGGPSGIVVQPKLMLGPVGDRYEQEADQVAKQVVGQVNGGAAQGVSQETGDWVQRTPTIRSVPTAHGMRVDSGIESGISRARGGGQPLSLNVRAPMEQAFAADFSGVRLHTGSHSDRLNRSLEARAFTTGQDIFFRQGAYRPTTSGGQELLAHELTHVVQQSGAQVAGLSSQGVMIQRWGDREEKKRRKEEIERREEERRRKIQAIWVDQWELSEKNIAESPESTIADEGVELEDIGPTFQEKKPINLSKLTKAAPLIDEVIPNPGDKSEIELEVEIPVDPAIGAFVGGRLTGEVARSKENYVKISWELSLGGGVKPGYAEVKGKFKIDLGGYIEVQGKDSVEALELVSYALYRRFRESSVLPREVGNLIWGGSKTGYEESEKWSAEVEKKVFSDLTDEEELRDIYAQTGGFATPEVGLKGGITKLSIKPTSYRVGKEYTKTSLEEAKPRKMGIELGEPSQQPSTRGKQSTLGTTVHGMTHSISIGVTRYLKFDLKIENSFKTKKGRPIPDSGYWTITLSGTASIPTRMSPVVNIVDLLIELINDALNKKLADGSDKQEATEETNLIKSIAKGAAFMFTDLKKRSKEKFIEGDTLRLPGTHCDIKFEIKWNKGGKGTFSIKSSNILKQEDYETGTYKASVKGTRLALEHKFEYDFFNWFFKLGEAHKVINKHNIY